MILIEIVCHICKKTNYVHDDGFNIYPEHCYSCSGKLIVPKEGTQKIADFDW